MKAVFLIGSYVPHQLTSINTLIERYGIEIHSYSISRAFKYIPEVRDKFIPYKFGDFDKSQVLDYICQLKPNIVVVAGWMIPEYTWICKKLKGRMSIPIVAMSDTPWYGTFKQKINSRISPFHLKKTFTHLWVAGYKQYDYARKLGFDNGQIIFNALTGDIDVFNQVDISQRVRSYPKNFLFIGRLTQVKGLNNLMQAWNEIHDKKGWTFTIVGSGELKQKLLDNDGFIVKDYMTQDLLLLEMQNSGCFVLPSLMEPWALVIHEAAAAGLPIVCSETCGAAPHFVIENFNGFKIKNNSVKDLKEKLIMVINKREEELIQFNHNSRKLSSIISPEIHSASLMQLFNEGK